MGQIKQGLINDQMVVYGNVKFDQGPAASILMPIPDKIRLLRDQVFTTGGTARPMAQGTPRLLMRADAARIRLVNNSSTADLDTRTANFLIAQGMNVTERGPLHRRNRSDDCCGVFSEAIRAAISHHPPEDDLHRRADHLPPRPR